MVSCCGISYYFGRDPSKIRQKHCIIYFVLDLDYIQNRREAAKSGYETSWRMNFLFYIVLVITIIVTFILYDIISDNYYR